MKSMKRWIVFPVALALITGLMLMAAGCPDVPDGKKTLTDIEVTTPPTKVVYDLNENFDPAGMVVTATYSDKSTAAITGYAVSKLSSDTIGEKTLTVTYQGKRARFTVNVIDATWDTVDTPVANPPGGTVPGNTRVALSTTTVGAQIWYTTNGSDPAQNGAGSTRYTVPLILTANVTIKAIAVREGMNKSEILEETYTVQTAAYTITQSGGVESKEDTLQLNFAFGFTIGRPQDGGIVLANITITPGTGEITADSLSSSPGPTRMMYITVIRQGTVFIKVNFAGVSDEEKEVMVYKKTGLENDPTVTIADVVQFGTPNLPNASVITFARYNGDPIAVLPPSTNQPITTISAQNPAFQQVIAVFDPPLDLTTTATRDFRWFDMIWDGFGKEYDFDTESGNATYTGTRYDLHMVTFQLELTTSADQAIVFQKRSDTDTSTIEKVPVRFLKSDITNTSTAWGTGHLIKAITLRASGMQLRAPDNSTWPNIGTDRNPVIEDTWIISLKLDARLPSAPYILYSTTGEGTDEDPYIGTWHVDITDPQWGLSDISASGNDATLLPQWEGKNGEQKIVYWEPIDITTRPAVAGTAEYYTVIVTYATSGGTNPSIGNWFGYGSISGALADDDLVKQQAFNGNSAMIVNRGIQIPLTGPYSPGNFNAQRFSGFFLQWDTGNVTVTEIRLE